MPSAPSLERTRTKYRRPLFNNWMVSMMIGRFSPLRSRTGLAAAFSKASSVASAKPDILVELFGWSFSTTLKKTDYSIDGHAFWAKVGAEGQENRPPYL